MLKDKLDSQFLAYLISHNFLAGDTLPSLKEISQDLGLSVGKLREQLEVARTLDIVSVRPRLGVQREAYRFAPAVLTSMLFGLGSKEATFEQFSQLRRAVEGSMWHEAVTRLTSEDKAYLNGIIQNAWEKLRGEPIHVPRSEHRALHLGIFRRLDNPFVQGVLEAYWDAYDAVEVTRYVRLEYWLNVWDYHEQIVTALCNNEFERGRQLLIEHFSILQTVSVGSEPVSAET